MQKRRQFGVRNSNTSSDNIVDSFAEFNLSGAQTTKTNMTPETTKEAREISIKESEN